MKVHIKLRNSLVSSAADGLSDTDCVKVIIHDFQLIEYDQKHVVAGEYCSKYCQWVGDCIGGRCESSPIPVTTPKA